MALFLSQSALGQGIEPPGGGGTSWWGGIPINIGPSWHAEAFPVGTDTFVGWEIDPAGEDVSYSLTYNWATNAWSKGGTACEPPGMGPYGYAHNGTLNIHAVSASSQGEITIKAQWTGGPLLPPPFLDLKMVSNTTFSHSNPGGGSGSDGIGGTVSVLTEVGYGVHGVVSTKKIRRFPVSGSGIAEFSYSPSAFSNANGYNSGCGAKAPWFDIVAVNRSAMLQSPSHPGYYKRVLTGGTGNWSIEDWVLPASSHSVMSYVFQYPLAGQGPNPPSYTATGMFKESKLGLPMYEWGNEPYPPGPVTSHVVSQGYVSGIDEGTYTYSGKPYSPSEHLPTLWQYWNILPLEWDKNNPYSRYSSGFDPKAGYFRDKFNSQEHAQDAGTTDTITFKYVWDSDGATANAELKLEFVTPIVRGELIGSHLEVKEPLTPPFTFPGQVRHGGWAVLPFQTESGWASNGSDLQSALWNSATVEWVAADGRRAADKVKASAGAVGLVPQLKWTAGLVGVFADLHAKFDPGPELLGVTRKPELFQKAYYTGNIDPLPIAPPNPETISQYEWKDMRRMLYNISAFADDYYDAEGYVKQSVNLMYDLGDYDERQMFRAVGQGGGG